MNLGWREVIWIVAGLAALYAVMQLGRLHGLRRARRAAQRVAATPPANFASELEIQQLRREVAVLREDIARASAAAQARHDRLEASLTALQERIDERPADSGLAPQYGEAMVFARRGLPADVIAERCGISVAEAELVRSLAQRGESSSTGSEP
ncbi:MAG: DUF2802 domain-containing protein [Zoogloeaceae bacterium]|nr:DUF2802 domain-containing protein [Zoogloeaceae bacterium]